MSRVWSPQRRCAAYNTAFEKKICKRKILSKILTSISSHIQSVQPLFFSTSLGFWSNSVTNEQKNWAGEVQCWTQNSAKPNQNHIFIQNQNIWISYFLAPNIIPILNIKDDLGNFWTQCESISIKYCKLNLLRVRSLPSIRHNLVFFQWSPDSRDTKLQKIANMNSVSVHWNADQFNIPTFITTDVLIFSK